MKQSIESRIKARHVVAVLGVILFVLHDLSASIAVGQETAVQEPPVQEAAIENADTSDIDEADESTEVESDFDVAIQLESFDTLWETIKKSHWDPEKIGDDWTAAKEKFRPMVESADSIDRVREVMGMLIDTLGQSHFGVIPTETYDEVEEGGDAGDSNTGMTLRLMDGGVGVSRIRPDSSAQRAGVEAGWMLSSVDGKAVIDIFPKLKKAVKGPMRFESLVGMVFTNRASGERGSKKDFVFVDGSGKSVELSLEMEEPPGDFTQFGNLPKLRVDFESKTLAGEIGYFRFSSFFDPVKVMPAYAKAVRDKNHKRGFIIDLRGNPGGMAGMTMGMARPFVKETVELGVMSMRGTELKFNAVAQPKPYTGTVVVLVDECSMSCSEIFSGGLQDLGIAHVIGSRTAGLALPSVVSKLPNGDGLQYAMADYHSKSGKSIEMDGVTPDETIELTSKLLQADADPAMTRAIGWINSQDEKE